MSQSYHQKIYTNPKYWGPHFWFMMRCIAFNYKKNSTPQEKQQIKSFYENFKHLLPCLKCKIHYAKMLKKYPLNKNMCCKKSLVIWVEKLYAEINEKQRQNKTLIQRQCNCKK